MSFTKPLLAAFADFEQSNDFDAYKAKIESTMDQIAQQSDAEKAKAFDVIFKSVRAEMTGPEETFDGNMMYYSGDSEHFIWEATHEAIFGKKFFDFYNEAYSGA